MCIQLNCSGWTFLTKNFRSFLDFIFIFIFDICISVQTSSIGILQL